MPVPLPDVPGAYLATIHGGAGGLPMNTLMAFGLTPNPTTGSADVDGAQAVANGIAAAWPAFALAVLHNSYVGDRVSCYPLHTPSHPAVESAMSAAGGLSGDRAPAPLALVVKHTVVRRGRGSQGRSYISFFSDGAIDAGGTGVIDTYRDSVTADWNTFVTACETNIDLAGVGASFYGSLSKKGAGHLYTVTGSVCESLLSTQRARAPR